jgi:hypothetical protein
MCELCDKDDRKVLLDGLIDRVIAMENEANEVALNLSYLKRDLKNLRRMVDAE